MSMILDNMTPDAWEAWFMNPGTEAFFNRLAFYRASILEDLGAARTVVSESMEQTSIETAKAVGEIAGLDYVLKRFFLQTGNEEGETEKD